MRYLGGKTRIAKDLARVILSVVPVTDRSVYIEPFVGSAAVFVQLAPEFGKAYASDSHPDLIMMWNDVLAGWEPPREVSKAEYDELKKSEPSALRGFVGFGCSFGGKWFDGYANPYASGSAVARETNSTVMKAVYAVQWNAVATFNCLSYDEWSPGPGMVVYCDPPYAGTTGYSTGDFDTERFWKIAGKWRDSGAHVFVSEYECPVPGAELVLEKEKRVTLNVNTGQEGLERLFYLRPKKEAS